MNRKTSESFYDHTNRRENVLEEIRYGIEGRNTVIETTTYIDAGRVISSTDRNGAVHSIQYDVMGNTLVKTNTDGTQTITKKYTYDMMGNLKTVNDGNEIMHYEYDGAGNKIREYGRNTSKFFYYNNSGLLTETDIYYGRTKYQKALYTYNEGGQVVKVSEGYWNSTAINTVSEYQYDVLGRRILAVNANGTSEKTEYNAAGLITRLTNYSGPNVISKYEYTYYYDGNQRTKTDSTGKTSYTYDDLGRLTEAQLADGTLQKYTFDGNGNRKTMTVTKDGTETLTEYAYDLNNRLICETKDGLTISYSYDNNGNMLSKSDGTSAVTQTFDVLNRMTAYEDGETTASYTYNPDNMRRSKTVTGVKTEHIWVGSEIVLDITGNSVVSYMNGIKSNYGWYVYNAHGDVVQLCDDNGVVTKSYDYDPYGNQLTEVDALDKNPYRYSGEYYDAESGYIYLRARYYDSTTGRFISEDPAFDGFNWYDYCGGNPLNRWDPSGQAWYDWVPGIAAVTVGTVMCATGFGTPIGIGLITGGASDLLSSTLGAAGFDSKFVSMATAGMDVVVGATLLLTPFAPVGAGMVGSGFGSLAGGAISESLGGSYELGAAIGNIVGGAMGSSVYNKLTLKAGSVELMNSNDQFLINARKRKDVDPNGVLDIVAHGDPYHIYMDNNIPMDPSEAAKMIRNMPEFHGQDIRLLSCNTGSLENGIAQQLANSLNVKVTAPNKYLWADIYGNLSIYGSRNGRCANCFDPGEWIEFLPIYK